jgi:hypothetical protein
VKLAAGRLFDLNHSGRLLIVIGLSAVGFPVRDGASNDQHPPQNS